MLDGVEGPVSFGSANRDGWDPRLVRADEFSPQRFVMRAIAERCHAVCTQEIDDDSEGC
jgi:hypothetical protein